MDSRGGTGAESFEGRLGALLLAAYAAGEEVEGKWYLMDTDSMVPDVAVVVERVDAGPDVPASREGGTFVPDGPADFKQRLQDFVLERFSDGDDIEGTWTVRYARGYLPDWEVEISTDVDSEIVHPGDEISRLE